MTGTEMRVRAALVLLGLSALAAPSRADEAAPADTHSAAASRPATLVVELLHEALLEVMKEAKVLGYSGRFERLEPVLDAQFDIPFMAEKSVGRHWKSAEPEERKALVHTFKRFTVANYAGRFDGYSGQRFETLGEEPSSRGTQLVRSQLVQSDGEIVQLNYRLRPVDGRWRIIDVYLNGTVSELALRRSEYTSLIQREGFDALLSALDERIAELASGDQAS